MKLLEKKILIEISVIRNKCNNCYWQSQSSKDSKKLLCSLFLYKKLKGNWNKGFKRCKKCLKTFENAKEV